MYWKSYDDSTSAVKPTVIYPEGKLSVAQVLRLSAMSTKYSQEKER